MRNKELDKILCDAYYEEIKQKLSALPSDDELRREFPVTKEKRDKFIKRVYGKKKPVYISYLQRVAIFVLVFSAVSFGAMMLNPEIRADMLEKGIKLFDKYFVFDIDTSQSKDNIDFNNIKIGYVPQEYDLALETRVDGYYTAMYSGKNDLYISINIANSDNKDDIMTSDSFINFDPIVINGCDGYTSYDSKEQLGLILWGNENFSMTVIGTMSIDELMKIATSIKY